MVYKVSVSIIEEDGYEKKVAREVVVKDDQLIREMEEDVIIELIDILMKDFDVSIDIQQQS